jgi:hypothetical protein
MLEAIQRKRPDEIRYFEAGSLIHGHQCGNKQRGIGGSRANQWAMDHAR